MDIPPLSEVKHTVKTGTRPEECYQVQHVLQQIAHSLPEKSNFIQHGLDKIKVLSRTKTAIGSVIYSDEYPGDDVFYSHPTILIRHIADEMGLNVIGKARSQILQEIWDQYPCILRYVLKYFLKPVSSNYIHLLFRNASSIYEQLPYWLQPLYLELIQQYVKYNHLSCGSGLEACRKLPSKHWSGNKSIFWKARPEILIKKIDIPSFLVKWNLCEYPSNITLIIEFQVEENGHIEHTFMITGLLDPHSKEIRYFLCQSYVLQYGLEMRELSDDEVKDYLEEVQSLISIDTGREFIDKYKKLFNAELRQIDIVQTWYQNPTIEVITYI